MLSLSGAKGYSAGVDYDNRDLYSGEEELEDLDRLVREAHWQTNPDSALYFAEQQLVLAKQTQLIKWQARALLNMGALLHRLSNYEEALAALQLAIPLERQREDWRKLSNLYRRAGSALRKMGQIPEALEAYQQGLLTAEKLGADGRSGRAATLNSMGSLYLNQKDFEKARIQYEESLRLHTIINKKSGIAANVNNLSKVYTAMQEYDVAQEFLHRSLALKRAENDLEGIANSNKNLGDIFLVQGMLDSAERQYRIALSWQDSLGLRGDEASSFADLGIVNLKEEKWQEATNWCNKGWEQAQAIGDLKVQVKNGNCLYKALQKIGKPKEALHILEQTRVLQDSFLSAANTREINKIELAYQEQKTVLEREIAATTPWYFYLFYLLLGLLGLLFVLYIRQQKKHREIDAEVVFAHRKDTEIAPPTPPGTTPPLPSKQEVTAADAAWVTQLNEVLKREIANPDFTVDQMAKALFISRSKLQRRVKKITGLTPVQHFRGVKLQFAIELLNSGKVETIKQVANAVGFDTPQYFARIFEQHFGRKPGEWL